MGSYSGVPRAPWQMYLHLLWKVCAGCLAMGMGVDATSGDRLWDSATGEMAGCGSAAEQCRQAARTGDARVSY